jgi:TolA-binding protein
MDELPNDLRDIIELARDGYDPPDGAQQRVRLALAAAIGAPAAGGALTGGKAALSSKAPAAIAAKAGWLTLGGKLTAAVVGMVAAAGIGFAVYTSRAPTPAPVAPPVVAPAPAVAQPPAKAQPQREQPRPEAAAPSVQAAQQAEPKPSKPRKVAPPADTLTQEMALLRAASEALAKGDQADALVKLDTHAKRYPNGSLREERDGLRAIAECTRSQNPSTEAATSFAQHYPSSLLTARVKAACAAR